MALNFDEEGHLTPVPFVAGEGYISVVNGIWDKETDLEQQPKRRLSAALRWCMRLSLLLKGTLS